MVEPTDWKVPPRPPAGSQQASGTAEARLAAAASMRHATGLTCLRLDKPACDLGANVLRRKASEAFFTEWKHFVWSRQSMESSQPQRRLPVNPKSDSR